MTSPSLKPDHLVYAVPDLAQAMDWAEEPLGVRPAIGGRHPGMGSHNALLSLGEDIYLEIIAPDPEQPDPGRPRPFGLDLLREPRLRTWAVATSDIEVTVAQARAQGYDPGPIVAGSRETPDGRRLTWRSTNVSYGLQGWPPPGDGLVPFLIEWGPDTVHPARTPPQGCQLVSLWGEHPAPEAIRAMLDALGVALEVLPGPEPALIAVIQTPKGRVTLR